MHPDFVRLFLSYAWEDRKWAHELLAHLKGKSLRVWDASQLSPGDNFSLETGKALEEADAMVVLVSPAAARSEWVSHELEYALTSKRFRGRLIPVIVQPTDKLPWILDRLPTEKGTPSQVSERIAKRLKGSGASPN